jgi:spermidine synthase
MKIDIDALQAKLDSEGYARVTSSLKDVGLGAAGWLLSTFGARAADLAPWLRGAEINRDRNLRLQYLAGLGLNSHDSNRTFEEMLTYVKFPDGLITGSPERIAALKKALGLEKK